MIYCQDTSSKIIFLLPEEQTSGETGYRGWKDIYDEGPSSQWDNFSLISSTYTDSLHKFIDFHSTDFLIHEALISINDIKDKNIVDEAKRYLKTIDEIINRVKTTLDEYLGQGLNKIIVVTHGGVIRRFIGHSKIEHCKPYEVDYCKDFPCYRWVD